MKSLFDGIRKSKTHTFSRKPKQQLKSAEQLSAPVIPRPVRPPFVRSFILNPRTKRAVQEKPLLHVHGYRVVAAGKEVLHALKSRRYYQISVAGIALFMFVVFGAGVWYGETTTVTKADFELPAVSPEVESEPLYYTIPLSESSEQNPVPEVLSNEVLFNTPLEVLKTYLEPQVPETSALDIRKEKLKAYLAEKKSPFVEWVDVIAEQPHWKLILAISFAESGLGKHCRYNNCSGIGGYEPNFRKYQTLGDWIVDFNSLLERRYKDWSLERMNGVYVQPKNPNWLLATKQILMELQERSIE